METKSAAEEPQDSGIASLDTHPEESATKVPDQNEEAVDLAPANTGLESAIARPLVAVATRHGLISGKHLKELKSQAALVIGRITGSAYQGSQYHPKGCCQLADAVLQPGGLLLLTCWSGDLAAVLGNLQTGKNLHYLNLIRVVADPRERSIGGRRIRESCRMVVVLGRNCSSAAALRDIPDTLNSAREDDADKGASFIGSLVASFSDPDDLVVDAHMVDDVVMLTAGGLGRRVAGIAQTDALARELMNLYGQNGPAYHVVPERRHISSRCAAVFGDGFSPSHGRGP